MVEHIVTAIADASVDGDRRWYGWAAWARNAGSFFEAAGADNMPKGAMVDFAELFALREAVKLAVGCARPGAILVLQSDCVAALDVLALHGAKVSRASAGKVGHRRSAPQLLTEMAKDTIAIAGDRFGAIWLKHVKGHTRVADGRSAINRRLDATAGTKMREWRATRIAERISA